MHNYRISVIVSLNGASEWKTGSSNNVFLEEELGDRCFEMILAIY